ncbi:MAG: signal peptidase II [Candidatus Neomarinimicrobiota bacterium]|nr:signal peptidase II [Candidatus Neomarinimicrobiota bacterium]|tara:strand:- start:674 stop:1147 length:474 start_codon:yes stop_codon:yes gene_type:complete
MSIFGLIVIIVALDQWSKWAIKTSFQLYESKPVIQDVFHFTYVTNDGMAFGLSFPGGKHILLVMTILLTGFIVGFLWKEKDGHPLVKYGLALILSGAIGNLTDRLFYGKVVDFLDIMVGNFHWYIFNVADSAVTVGMVLFIIHSFLIEESSEDKLAA